MAGRKSAKFKRDAAYVTAAIVVVSIAFKLIEPYTASSTDREHSIAKSMIEEAKQWFLTSAQDQNSQSKYEHISFASAYLNSARHILNDIGLERISGIDVHELQKSIDDMKKTTSRDIFRQCPRLKQNMPQSGKVPPLKKKSPWIL